MGDFFTNVLPNVILDRGTFNAQQATQRAELQAQLSRQALDRTQQINAGEESNARRRASEAIARARARYGVSGVALEGSPLLALADLKTDSAREIETLTLRNRARTEAAFGRSLLDQQRADHARDYAAHIPYFKAWERAESAVSKPGQSGN